MKILYEKLQNSLYICLGFFIIFLVFYHRVIIERLPKDLHLFIPDFNFPLFFVMLSWLFLCLNIIYFNCKIILNIKIKQTRLTKYSSKLSDIIDIALHKVYGFFVSLVPNMYYYVSNFCWHFYSLFHNLREDFFLKISYIIRFILVFVFLYDVFVLFKLHYFYKCLIFLIIPIIKNLIFFILRDYAQALEHISPALKIDIINEEHYIFSKNVGYEHIDLNSYIQEFIQCTKIQGYLDEHRAYSEYYTFRVYFVIYFLYLFGWLFVIFKNIYLFNL